jgi:hypothetical protein
MTYDGNGRLSIGAALKTAAVAKMMKKGNRVRKGHSDSGIDFDEVEFQVTRMSGAMC